VLCSTAKNRDERFVHEAAPQFNLRWSSTALHRRDLPGTPDIVLPGRGMVVFVHGCFWHGHRCKVGKMPKSRIDYWGPKIEANKARDKRKSAKLRRLGWSVVTVYECELKLAERLAARLLKRIGS